MGHNSAKYIHTLTEALKLAFADREKFYGDPNFITVPITGILSKQYAKECAERITEKACPIMPHFGNPWPYNNQPMPDGFDMSYETVADNDAQNDNLDTRIT